MCKVLIIPGIKSNKIKETKAFIDVIAKKMSVNNSDGLGYAAVDANGELFGERWFVNNDFFVPPKEEVVKDFSSELPYAQSMMSQFGDALNQNVSTPWSLKPSRPNYNRFGTGGMENMSAITLHTRYATCERSLRNTHPFVDKDTSVIHNGVISNHAEFDLKLSTCDSESILISYLDNKVNEDINNAQKMVDTLSGHYACGVFSRDAQGNRILDVFKQNNNNLCIGYVFELDTYVFTTSEADLKSTCEVLGFTLSGIQDVKDGHILRIDPYTGTMLAKATYVKTYAPKSYSNNCPSYNGATVYKPKSNTFEKKYVSNSLAKMYSLPSTIEELSNRDTEEHLAYWGQ